MGKLTSMHFYGWKKGLKTGMYYLRTQAASAAIQFTIDSDVAATASSKVADLSNLHRPTYVAHASSIDSDVSRPGSESPKEIETATTSVASLSLEDADKPLPAPAPAAAAAETPAEPSAGPAPTEGEAETDADIFSSKVIACAINNPEACEMCSG